MTATNPSLLPRGVDSRLRALLEHRALELCKGADHLHHHAAGSGGGVDGFSQAAKPGFCALNPLHQRDNPRHGAHEEVSRWHQLVVGLNPIQ